MMCQSSFDRPPRLAVWLVDLFTPMDKAESILGDLVEEFAELASKSGVAVARSWYWRQSFGTIAHLVGDGFLVAPWLVVGTAAGGYFLGWALYLLTQKAVVSVLCKYQVYAHIDAYTFWLLYAILIERLIQPLLMGCLVAATAKGREMVPTLMVSLAIFAGNAPGLVQSRHYWLMANVQILPLFVTTFASPFMVAIGGGIVRKHRLAMSRRSSMTHC